MNATRRGFIEGAALFGAAAGLSPRSAASAPSALFRAEDYAALRAQLRAFYPDECHGVCKDPRQEASARLVLRGVEEWAALHPDCDAFDLRRESYRLMSSHFQPFIFTESPFYFEAGVNGGWAGVRPGRMLRDIACRRFVKRDNLFPDEALRTLNARRDGLFILCGPFIDPSHHIPPFRTIFTKGFSGVRAETEAALAACPADDVHGRKLLETGLAGLDCIHALQLSFARMADAMLAEGGHAPEVRTRLSRIAESARRCPWEPPRTFYEGLNTLWFLREILGYVDGLANYALGRPDAWLIGLYRADLAAGRLTEAEARDLVCRFLEIADCHHDSSIPVHTYGDHEMEIPITLGGCDGEGRPICNELTDLFLDAHIGLNVTFPKLHVRIAPDSPSAYLRKIGAQLMRGHAVFALFNDKVTVAQFVKRGIPVKLARDYVCCGCWDPNVDSITDVDTANYISVARVLEATIHRDMEVENQAKIRIDPIDDARCFEEVRDTLYRNFIRFYRSVLGDYTRFGRQNARLNPHPLYSMCLEGCKETRQDVTEGGSVQKPRIVTLAFLANVVDSLCAIRQLCFEERVCTLTELLDAVRADWRGERGELLRTRVLATHYWGDNSEMSNSMMRWWIDSIARDTEGCVNDRGGPYELATWIYREFLYWGARMKATPDGRRAGEPLAQGFAPSEFRCRAGATEVLNAIGSLDHSKLYASNANLTFDKTAMSPEVFEAIFRVCAKRNMHLLQPNCNSVDELLDAQIHPERHLALMVKVCGFSARFVELDRRWQNEVIARHRLK